jgi:hypothetical protein
MNLSRDLLRFNIDKRNLLKDVSVDLLRWMTPLLPVECIGYSCFEVHAHFAHGMSGGLLGWNN